MLFMWYPCETHATLSLWAMISQFTWRLTIKSLKSTNLLLFSRPFQNSMHKYHSNLHRIYSVLANNTIFTNVFFAMPLLLMQDSGNIYNPVWHHSVLWVTSLGNLSHVWMQYRALTSIWMTSSSGTRLLDSVIWLVKLFSWRKIIGDVSLRIVSLKNALILQYCKGLTCYRLICNNTFVWFVV